MENFFLYSIIGGVVSFTIWLLNRQARKKVEPSRGERYELRLNKLYLYLGIVGVNLGILGFTLPVLYEDDWVSGSLLFLILGGPAFACWLWYVNHGFVFDDTSIEATSVYGKRTAMKWEDIQKISFSTFSGLLTFSDGKGKKVKAHQHLVGLGELAKMMEEKTKWTAKEIKLPV